MPSFIVGAPPLRAAEVVEGVLDMAKVVMAARLMKTVASCWGGPSERRRVQS